MTGLPPFVVVYDADAVIEFQAVTGKADRKALLNAIDKLRRLGPQLAPPHVKTLKGESKLLELRPRAGRSAPRPICRPFDRTYVVLAIAATHDALNAAVAAAQDRAQQYLG